MTESAAESREVLIVDDQPENLTVLRKMLSEYGYTVRAAINGELALKTVADTPPDLILLDIMMPEMDGYQVCRRLKEEEESREIPVLFVSALSDTVDKMRGFALGAVDYITKPFREEEVLARVGAHMDLKKSRDALKETLRIKNDTLVLQQAIFETVPETIITVDKQLNIMSCNKELRTVCSEYGADDAEFGSLLETGEGPCSELLLETLRTRKPVRDRLALNICGSNRPHPISLSCTPLVDSENRFFGAALVIRDVSHTTALEKLLGERRSFLGLTGKSAPVQRLYTLVEQVAATDIPVRLYGEAGTETVQTAEALHAFSGRSDKALVRLHCRDTPAKLIAGELFGYKQDAFDGAAADHEGCFRQATSSTLFLEEVDALPLEVQADLLHVLTEKAVAPLGQDDSVPVDVRIIVSTAADLKDLVANGDFLEQLAEQLTGITIAIPALRERLEDLPLLCGQILRQLNAENRTNIKGVAPEAMERFFAHDWPGNVAELKKTLEQAAAVCSGDWITPADLPQA